MDCKAATQGTELDPSFKGDWTTRAVGVACSLDDVVPTWIALHPALGYRSTVEEDSTSDGEKRWVSGPVFKVQDVPAEPLDMKAPLPNEREPRSKFKVRDLLDGEKRTYPTIDALREALKPGDWPMRNVVSVNLGAVTPSEALTKFVSEELGELAPKLEYLDISSLTHRSFTHVELAKTIKSAQRLRVLLMPRDFGPSFRAIEFHPWLEYVRFSRRCDDVEADAVGAFMDARGVPPGFRERRAVRAAFDQVLALHRAHCKKLADRKGRPVNEWTAEQLLQQVREEFGGGLLDARTASKVTTAFERAGVTGADLATAAEPEAVLRDLGLNSIKSEALHQVGLLRSDVVDAGTIRTF